MQLIQAADCDRLQQQYHLVAHRTRIWLCSNLMGSLFIGDGVQKRARASSPIIMRYQ